MLFDVQAALAEILASPIATPATSATPDQKSAPVSQVSRLSQPLPREIVTLGNVPRIDPPARNPSGDGEIFPHGQDAWGRPRTWTGAVLSLEAWRDLTEWERHGPAGRLFCGICRTWETPGTCAYRDGQHAWGLNSANSSVAKTSEAD